MSLIRSITTVGNFTIISRLVGFLRDLLMANYIGTGPVMDAIVVAIKIPSFFRRIFAEGAFNATFVPLFAGTLSEKGSEEARTYAQEIMSVLVCILIVIVVVVELIMPQFIGVTASGFHKTPDRFAMAVEYTRITFPYLLLISLTALYSGILNSLDRFVAAASSPAAGNVFLVLALLLAGGTQVDMGPYVATAILLSGVVQLLWVMVPSHRANMTLHLIRPRMTPKVKTFLTKMVPGALGSGVVQINLFIGTLIASHLPVGGVSFLYYADRLNQLPLSVIGTAVSTALLPLMSRQLRQDNIKAARHNQNRALEFGLLLVLPATVALIIGAEPFVKVLFERGEFTPEAAWQTSLTLMGYACGLPAYILIKIFATSFFARQDTKTPMIVAGVSVVVDIVFSLALFSILHHVGIALATALASWFNAGVLGYLLHKRDLLHLDARLKRFLPRATLATFIMGVGIYEVTFLTTPWLNQGDLMRTLALITIVASGLILYFALILATKAINFKELKQKPFA